MPCSFHMLAVLALLAGVFSADAVAQQHLSPWQPAPGRQQVPIWPEAAPNPVVYDGPEYSKVEDDLMAEKPWISDERVSVPTMTVYPPKAENTAAAVVIFPGGGIRSSLWI